MTNTELIAKIKAEIERRMDKHWEGLPNADAPEDDWTHNELCELGAYKELEHLETFLSTLESEKPVPNDLEEAANKFAVFYDQGTCDGIAQDCFIAGAKWQAEQDEKEQADLFTIVALDAAQRAKEQMMKDIPKWHKLIVNDLRDGFIQGYEQAEKDLALTWEDIRKIVVLFSDVSFECFDTKSANEMCEETLTRFKQFKEGQQ